MMADTVPRSRYNAVLGELDEARQILSEVQGFAKAEILRLQAERDKYRDALRDIVSPHPHASGNKVKRLSYMLTVASAALAPTPSENE